MNMKQLHPQWLSSRETLKQAFTHALLQWKPILWLLVGQLAVLITVIGLHGYFVSLALSDSGQLFYSSLLLVLVFLYQLVLTISVVQLLAEDKPASLITILRKVAFPKLVGVFALSLILSIGISIATTFFIIPGIVLTIWWLLVLFFFILEGTSIKDSLEQSRLLARFWWFPLFARLTFAFLLGGLITVFSIVPSIGDFITTALSLLFGPIVILFFGKTYMQLRMIKSRNMNVRSEQTLGQKIWVVIWGVLVLGFVVVVSLMATFVTEVIQLANTIS